MSGREPISRWRVWLGPAAMVLGVLSVVLGLVVLGVLAMVAGAAALLLPTRREASRTEGP